MGNIFDWFIAVSHLLSKSATDLSGDSTRDRVASARMSQTRMKALPRPDYLPAAAQERPLAARFNNAFVDETDDKLALPPFKPQGAPNPTRPGDVSNFRLAAYAATLTNEERSPLPIKEGASGQ